MSALTAAQLSPLLNGYLVEHGPPKSIIVPNASKIAALQDVTVSGTLLKKQLLTLTAGSAKRKATLASGGGKYPKPGADGDLHFCLGVKQGQPHISCELQNAKAWIPLFNKSLGTKITVSGLFRCMFEHPGFRQNDDAHIFEIHPVRAVVIDGKLRSFDVDIPDQQSIHTWTQPHPLNNQDSRIKVKYDNGKDTLIFTDMDGQDENYVEVSGNVSQVKLNTGGDAPASFIFDSPEIGRPLTAYCLQGTSAARQLDQLGSGAGSMIALRNIDLGEALKNHYVINLLTIDLKPAGAGGLRWKQR
jgi:hypothetical protein